MSRSTKLASVSRANKGVQRLLEIMSTKGLSQAEMARAIGCNRSVLNKWLHGVTTPGLDLRFVLRAKFRIALQAWDSPVVQETKAQVTRCKPSLPNAAQFTQATGTDDE